jgi:hypothetical protein
MSKYFFTFIFFVFLAFAIGFFGVIREYVHKLNNEAQLNVTFWELSKEVKKMQRDYKLKGSGVVYKKDLQSNVFHEPGCGHYNCEGCTPLFTSRKVLICNGLRPCRE